MEEAEGFEHESKASLQTRERCFVVPCLDTFVALENVLGFFGDPVLLLWIDRQEKGAI